MMFLFCASDTHVPQMSSSLSLAVLLPVALPLYRILRSSGGIALRCSMAASMRLAVSSSTSLLNLASSGP
eukprot:942235-Amphidinium_carterae.1